MQRSHLLTQCEHALQEGAPCTFNDWTVLSSAQDIQDPLDEKCMDIVGEPHEHLGCEGSKTVKEDNF